MNIYSFLIICFLYFYGGILLYLTINAKKKGIKGAFYNNLGNALVFLISITISVFIVNYSNLSNIDFIVFPFDILMLSFIILFFPFFYILIYLERRRIKHGKRKEEEQRTFDHEELPIKYEVFRKLSHLVVLGIILFYFTLGFLIQYFFEYIFQILPEFLSELFYSIFIIEGEIMIFTQYLVIYLVGISLIGLLTADFIRILKPEIYPFKKVNRILREKELHTRLGPQISMSIGCFSIIVLYGLFQPIGPLIICTSMTMAILGDIAANLFGRTLGQNRKHIRDTKKTYVGLFAGIGIAYISGILILISLRSFYIISIPGFFLLPLIGALIIGIIDYLDLEVDDNLTYNFVVTTVLFFIAIFIA